MLFLLLQQSCLAILSIASLALSRLTKHCQRGSYRLEQKSLQLTRTKTTNGADIEMAEHTFTKDAGAALLFAILYAGLFAWMLAGYITGRYKIRSRWSLLFFHVAVRVVSQVRRGGRQLAVGPQSY